MANQLLNPRNTHFQTTRWNELHANFVHEELTTQSEKHTFNMHLYGRKTLSKVFLLIV